jgi:hypothetical protein
VTASVDPLYRSGWQIAQSALVCLGPPEKVGRNAANRALAGNLFGPSAERLWRKSESFRKFPNVSGHGAFTHSGPSGWMCRSDWYCVEASRFPSLPRTSSCFSLWSSKPGKPWLKKNFCSGFGRIASLRKAI